MFTSLSRLANHKHRFVLLTTALLFIPLFGGWFDEAVRNRASSFQVGIFQNPSGPGPAFHLFSFGLVAFILLVCLWRATVRDRRQKMVLLSASLVVLAFDFALQIGIGNPAWLKLASDGVGDFKGLMSFANSYSINTLFLSPPDAGLSGDLPTSLPQRVSVMWYCLSYGWQAFTLLSIVALVGTITAATGPEMSPRPSYPFKAWVIVWVLIIWVQISGPIAAQLHLQRAETAVVQRKPWAENEYRRAINDDPWYRLVPDVYARIGTFRRGRGDTTSPEALFALGREDIARNLYDPGMEYLLRADALTRDPAFRQVLRDEIANDSITQGRTYYSRGAQGLAQQEWQRAVQLHPEWIQTAYMVGRVEQDMARYQSARAWYQKVEDVVHPPAARALAMNAIGDTYYLSGQLDTARQYYTRSLATSYSENLRGMKSLLDDYYR